MQISNGKFKRMNKNNIIKFIIQFASSFQIKIRFKRRGGKKRDQQIKFDVLIDTN